MMNKKISEYSSSSASFKFEPELGEAPCQNCGILVTILLPFVGCVFCSDCIKADSSYEATAENFQEKWKYNSLPLINQE